MEIGLTINWIENFLYTRRKTQAMLLHRRVFSTKDREKISFILLVNLIPGITYTSVFANFTIQAVVRIIGVEPISPLQTTVSKTAAYTVSPYPHWITKKAPYLIKDKTLRWFVLFTISLLIAYLQVSISNRYKVWQRCSKLKIMLFYWIFFVVVMKEPEEGGD